MKLDGVAADAEPKIERKQKDALIVVTVPKSDSMGKASPTIPDPALSPQRMANLTQLSCYCSIFSVKPLLWFE